MTQNRDLAEDIAQSIGRINAAAHAAQSALRSKDDKIASLRAELNEAREAGANMLSQIDEANETTEQFKTAATQWRDRYWELRNTPPEQAPAPSISLDSIYFKKIADRLNNENRALREVSENRLAEIERQRDRVLETLRALRKERKKSKEQRAHLAELHQLRSRERELSVSTFSRTENAVGKAKELVEYLQETAQRVNPHSC